MIEYFLLYQDGVHWQQELAQAVFAISTSECRNCRALRQSCRSGVRQLMMAAITETQPER